MSVSINRDFKGDNNAEFHRVVDCEGINDPSYLVCMVCGEDVSRDAFSTGVVVDCPDCGIHLEVVDGYLAHFTSEKNENCAEEFYGRIK